MSEAAAPRVGYGDALRSHEFRALFTAQAITIGGSSIAAVALTVLVYDRTGSAFLSSLTFALGFLPYVVAGLLSGVVDRVRPRRLVNAATGASAVIALAMAAPGIPTAALLVLLFSLGLLAAFSGGARVTLIRSTVTDEAYVPGRSLMKLASQIAQIGGNAVGGALVAAIGTSGAILVNAGSFALAFALVRFGVGDYPNLGGSRAAGLLRDSLGGATEIFATPAVGRLLLLGWLVPLLSVAPEALAAPYVASHGGSPQLVGWWLAALPIGTIVGDLLGVRFLRPSAQQAFIGAAAAAGFVPYLFFGADPPVAAGIALLVISGLFGMWSLGLDGRLRSATPERLFARMMTLNSAGLMTLQGVGFALAGAIGGLVGPATAVAVAGVCGLVVVASLGFARLDA